MNDIGVVRVLGYCWPSAGRSEGRSFASSDPESLSHDKVDGWISRADYVNGWRNLLFSNEVDGG